MHQELQEPNLVQHLPLQAPVNGHCNSTNLLYYPNPAWLPVLL